MWTRKPLVRLLSLPLIGIWIHVAVFVSLFGTMAVIAFATGIYRNVDWPGFYSASWVWYLFGVISAPLLIGCSACFLSSLVLQKGMQEKDERVILHLILMVYWLFRCAFCLCMMLTTSWLGPVFIITLEFVLAIAALVLAALTGIGYLFYLIPNLCIERCKEELRY